MAEIAVVGNRVLIVETSRVCVVNLRSKSCGAEIISSVDYLQIEVPVHDKSITYLSIRFLSDILIRKLIAMIYDTPETNCI